LKTKLLYFVIAFGFLILNTAYSQQGKVDSAFNSFDDGLQGDGFDGAVRAVSLQPDGKLIVGGEYLNFNGSSTPYLCRLLPDGSKDLSFAMGASFSANIYSTLLQADGKIIVGGSFTTFNGSSAGKLIRLNTDGSRDNSFDTAIAASTGIVYSIALQSDGNVIIVGSFTKYNNTTANKITRILPNGNLDTTFATGTGASGVINTVQIQSDGKVIIAGTFTTFNGVSCNRIIRLNPNGSIDTTFSIGTGFNDDARTLALQTDGKILVGGDFTTYNGIGANRIVRLNTDGTVDSSFNLGSGFSDSGVYVIKLGAGGSIMVGGSFNAKFNGVDVNKIVSLDANGVLNPAFDIGTGPASSTVLTMVNESAGSWYMGGSFSVFDSQNQGRLAKIDGMGTLDIGYLTAGVGFDNSVLKVIALSDNKTMAFGNFIKFNGTPASRIARLLGDGTVDMSFNPSATGANNSIKSGAIQTDAKIVFAGSFTSYNGITTNRIARVLPDGGIDASFVIGTGFNNQVYALALQSDGKIIVVGNFTSYNGTPSNRIVRLLPDGTLDTTFNIGLGADAIVEAVIVQPDGKIVLGGRFSTFNGNSYHRMVRLNADGSIDLGFSIGTGFDKNVYSIALQSDNKLIVGGVFLNYNGTVAKRILRLNNNGNLDVTFTVGSGFSNGEIRTILVQPDDRIILGGTFSGTFNGIAVKRMVRLLSSGDYDTTFLVHLNGTLFSTCFTPNNKLIIGGGFNSVSGITKHRVARIKLCTNSSVWNGNAWNNGLPSVERTLIFNGNYTSLASVNACSCSINTGNTVTIPDGNTLGLDFDYSGLGTLILENNAALYQSEDQVSNTGVIQLKRKTTPILLTDYTYWSSPVPSQKLIDVSPETPSDKFYSFDASKDSWTSENPTNIMSIGKGYIIRGPKTFSETISANHEAIFRGVPNNGLVSVLIAGTDTSNLIGNPYPSAINADLFINTNKEIIEGTIYLWTHNTAITKNVYTSDDYAVYNLLGGVGTSAAVNSGVNNSKPDGKIASGQSFFVTGLNSGGTAIFNNTMRVVGQNSNFFKVSPTKKAKANEVEKHRIWLNLLNTEGAFKQILIGYATGATNNFDSSFDGESFDGNQYLDFYSINQDKNFVIQGRTLPFDKTDEIKLGFTSTVAGNFIIKIDQTDGLLVNQAVFLEDKLNNKIVDLRVGGYSFSTAIGKFDHRFVLRFVDKTLNVNEIIKDKESVFVSSKNKELRINSTKEFIEEITIYNLEGRKIYQKNSINNLDFSISNCTDTNQVLVVKILLQNGQSFTKKIIPLSL
jgi:uncharacterized delta-60 repeat protein